MVEFEKPFDRVIIINGLLLGTHNLSILQYTFNGRTSPYFYLNVKIINQIYKPVYKPFPNMAANFQIYY